MYILIFKHGAFEFHFYSQVYCPKQHFFIKKLKLKKTKIKKLLPCIILELCSNKMLLS